MNWLDIVLAIPILWFTYKGIRNGLVIELASLGALIIGVFVALHFSFYVEDYLRDNFDVAETYLSIISFAITFIIVAVLIHLAGKLIHKLIQIVALGLLNRLAGGLFGFIKAALILSVILYFVNAFDTDSSLIKQDIKDESHLYKPIQSIVPMIIPQLDKNGIRIPKVELPSIV